MNYTCYIVDDEAHAIGILNDFITRTHGLSLMDTATDPLKALEDISTSPSPPDITFLDVDMPELSGLEFAGLVNQQTTIIFVTAYREYAVEAFEKQALDYLLKPISYERFLKTIQRIRTHRPSNSIGQTPAEPFFFVNPGIKGQFTRVPVAEIRYIAAALNYVEIHLREEKIMTYMSLAEALDKLPKADFSRIHKSYIINHAWIKSITYGQIRLKDQAILPIGRVYRKTFHQRMRLSFSPGSPDQEGDIST